MFGIEHDEKWSAKFKESSNNIVKSKHKFRYRVYIELRSLDPSERKLIFGCSDIEGIMISNSAREIMNKIFDYEESIAVYRDEAELLREVYAWDDEEIKLLTNYECNNVAELLAKFEFEELNNISIIRSKIIDNIAEGAVVEVDGQRCIIVKAKGCIIEVIDKNLNFRQCNLIYNKVTFTNEKVNVDAIKRLVETL